MKIIKQYQLQTQCAHPKTRQEIDQQSSMKSPDQGTDPHEFRKTH